MSSCHRKLQQLGGRISPRQFPYINFAYVTRRPKRFIKHLVENVVSPLNLVGGTRIVDLHWEPLSQVCSTDPDRHGNLGSLTFAYNEPQAVHTWLKNLGQKKITGGIELVEWKRRTHRPKINGQDQTPGGRRGGGRLLRRCCSGPGRCGACRLAIRRRDVR